ncbi:ABC transporter substrate-binding protein [Pseudochryseolinea flava]|uniref:Cobalamin-binding protein n=1 Tax=Pseudochryseolinea flava TaxID=2059302 RepID=A0A364XUN3_9BACT|nr:helical backbone metal receptor [Pseudochryseolinea flava]RAV97668.1 cobalamin-binding protein [Pseudochryseolinea flava]
MESRSFLDQMNHLVTINFPPRRIVSLVPSQTELLADLDLDEKIVGITKFCVHPQAWISPKKIVGGTKQFNFEVIQALEPDLIIANKEENYQEGINRLRAKYPVWTSDIVSIEDAVAMVACLGQITDTKEQAENIIASIHESFEKLISTPPVSALYLIWHKPWMAAGRDTFINTLLEKMGLRNAVPETRYPEISEEYIQAMNPDYILLSSEPFPFKEKHVDMLQQLLPQSKIILVDGEMFSWYGSRLIKAPAYFNSLNFQ